MVPPKLTSVFLTEADTSTPEFKKWFRNSKVVDKNGNPAVVYHGTVAGDFRMFTQYRDVGHHFGTPQAASDRLDYWARGEETKDKPGRVVPVFLSIQNPVEVDDLKVWRPEHVAGDMVETGAISVEEYRQVAMRASREDKNEELRKVLKKRGYDGLKYHNAVEGQGSVSWVALDPNQIKSMFNRGTWDPRRGNIDE